jgi:aromatic-L-amino-acid/L-tryptophan decarboxylase
MASAASSEATTTTPAAAANAANAANNHDDDPLPPDLLHPMDAEAFRRAGHAAVDFVADYYSRLTASADADAQALAEQHGGGAPLPLPPPAMPVAPPPDGAIFPGYLPPQLPRHAPERGEPWGSVMHDYQQLIEPGLTHWQHPSFYAYFPGATSYPGVLSEILVAATNTVGFSWAASPAATELEHVAMDWLARLCGLPAAFQYFPEKEEEEEDTAAGDEAGEGRQEYSSGNGNGADGNGNGADGSDNESDGSSRNSNNRGGGGSIQGTSSEAVIVAMLAARARAMQGRPPEDALKLVCYGSDQAHSCYAKAARVLGLPPGHSRVLACRESDGFAMRPEALRAQVRLDLQQGLIPFFAMATIGTTSSCAVDPVAELSRVLHEETEAALEAAGAASPSSSVPAPLQVWLHVDAAYAGAFAVLPDERASYFSSAYACVDSYSYNPHKAGLVTFDCCAMWARDLSAVRDALALTPVFLRARGNEIDFKDLQVPLGRRFRALKLWSVLRVYGAEGLRAHAEHHRSVARWLARRVAEDARFELAAEPRFGLVCFRLRDPSKAPSASSSASSSSQTDRARELNRALLQRVNASGRAFLINTELEGVFTLRAAVGALNQQPRHVEALWRLLQREAAAVLLEAEEEDGEK